MADVVTKSVRLMDKEVRLYPRVKLEDIVKSVTADGTETVVKLVEQSNNENIVYGTKVTGGLLQQATITYSESLKGSTIPVRTAGGMLLVENPSSDTPQAAVNLLYANTTYGRLGAGNDWTNLNRFNTESISVHATDKSIYMKLTNQGFVVKTSPSSEEHNITLQDANGTIAYLGDVSSTATSTLASAKTYTDQQINAKLSSALKYKGSKDTYADLPKTGNQVGDVWNVVAAYGNAHAGTNWAWNGTVWDPLGGTIDLTNYVTAPAAFTTGGMLVEVSGTGTGRIIKQSTYAAGAMSASNHPAGMLPNADSVYTYVNSKISGSIWDSTKVVYAKTSDTNTSWAVTTPHILVSETDESGHILAREGYIINNDNLAETNDQIPTSKVVSDAINGPIGVLQSSKLDKKVTAGEYAYVHNSATQTEYKLYGGLSSTIPGGAIPYTAPDGALAAETTGVSFLSSTATGIAVSVASTALKKLINGSILQSLVNSINTSLSLINNSLITYEEVS